VAASRASRLAKKPHDQYHHGDLGHALLQAALRTIQKHGVHALTLRAVGEDLGVSRTALYRHFSDKAALLAAVAGEGFRLLRLELHGAWEDAGKGLAGFEAMGEGYVRFACAHSSHYRVMFGSGFDRSGSNAELEQEGPASFQVLIDAIVELQARGLVLRDDPLMLARFIWSLVHGIAMLAIDGALHEKHADADVDALARYAVERLRTGIGVRESEHRTDPR
jgi:AcrR family transcriptional regulator